MVELRATKRRKLTNYHQNEKVASGGDKATQRNKHDVHALLPSSPDVAIKKDDGSSPNGVTDDILTRQVPRDSPMQRYSNRLKRTETTGDNGGNGDEDSTAISQSNTRTSERQRRAPQRYGDAIKIEVSQASKIHTTSSATKSRASKSTRKSRGDPITGDIVGESLTFHENSPGQRSKKGRGRTAVVENQASSEENKIVNEESDGLETAEGTDIDYDDSVSVQLQQDLSQNDKDKPTEQITTPVVLPDYAAEFQKLCASRTRKVRTLSKVVLEKLTGKRLVPVKELQDEYQKIYQLVEHTIVSGEGNSMLVLGSRGSGKTTMVETAISSLSRQHKDDFYTVRLSGFLHTDDRLALREIWRQLGRETNTEDEAAKVNNYADTMATLLALFSHPEEIFGPQENSDAIATAKAVVIVLDEFELFASHSRQTLLYNLFDIAQARKAPLAVIGLTTKVDVTELLEKRVKSRFSHRYVFLPLPRTLESFSEICLAGLSVEDGMSKDLDCSSDEESSLLQSGEGRTLVEGWNAYVKGLFVDKQFQSHLQLIYYQTKSVKEFFTSALHPLSTLYHSTYEGLNGEPLPLQVPTPESFMSPSLSCPDPPPLPFPPSTSGLSNTSSLPLSLLLAAARLTALHDPGVDVIHSRNLTPLTLSFAAAYAEYVRLLTSAKANASASGATATPGRVWGRDVAREAWEKLINWGAVVPVGGGTGVVDGRLYRVEVSLEEVADMAGGGGALGRWWRDG